MKTMNKPYYVITAFGVGSLEDQVGELIILYDYIPLGGVAVSIEGIARGDIRIRYTQAMVKRWLHNEQMTTS